MLHHADSRLLNAYPFSGAETAIAAVNLSQLLLNSSTTSGNHQPKSAAPTSSAASAIAHSPLNSESSSNSTTTTTNLECSKAPPPQDHQISIHSSVWSEILNGAAANSFMGDNLDNAIPASSSLSSTAPPPVTSSASGGGTAVSSWWSGRDQDDQLPAVHWSQTAGSTQGLPDLEGGDWSPGQLGCLPTAPEVSEQHMAIEHSDFTSTMNTTLVDPDQISGNPASWGSILIGSSGNEEASLDNEAFFSSMKLLNKAVSEPWPEFNPLKSSAAAASGFESIDDDMMIKQQQHQHQQQFSLPSHHLNMDSNSNWASRAAAEVFGSQLVGGRSKIKQEMDTQFLITHQQQQQQSMLPPNPNSVLMSNEVPSPSRWGAHSSRLPAMLSQVLPSTSSSCKRGGNLFGSSGSRSFGNYVSPKAEPALYSGSKAQQQREQSCSMSQHSSGITSQHSHDSKDSHASKHLMDESREVLSSEPVKRGSNSSSDHPETFFKRPRIEQQQQQQQAAPTLPFKATTFVLQVRKEKLGERITALQQLVAPFGKTDTASVLLEAIGYIKFLHEQVQVLSTPYMKNAVAGAGAPGRPNVEGAMKGSSSSWAMSSSEASNKSRESDEPRQDLRSRGLCLVPISCTLQVANDNGADFWTPNIGGGGGGGVAGGGGAGGGGSAK